MFSSGGLKMENKRSKIVKNQDKWVVKTVTKYNTTLGSNSVGNEKCFNTEQEAVNYEREYLNGAKNG